MSVDLERAEQLAAAATPGPWKWVDDIRGKGGVLKQSAARWPWPVIVAADNELLQQSDAEFIAAARELVPALVARVRELTNAGNAMATAVARSAPVAGRIHNAVAGWRSLVAEDDGP